MSSIDVGQLYSDDVLHHVVGWHKSASQQVGHHVNNLLVKFGKPRSGLTVVDNSTECRKCIPQHFLLDLVTAVLDDPLHLLMNKLHAPQAGLLQPLNLPFDQQLEADLRYKECGSRPVAVPDCRQNVHGGQTYKYININLDH